MMIFVLVIMHLLSLSPRMTCWISIGSLPSIRSLIYVGWRMWPRCCSLWVSCCRRSSCRLSSLVTLFMTTSTLLTRLVAILCSLTCSEMSGLKCLLRTHQLQTFSSSIQGKLPFHWVLSAYIPLPAKVYLRQINIS